jgi:hypothetical protein
MTSSPLPPCRLSLLFAAEAPIVMILRRGPSEWMHPTTWNIATDVFEPGHGLHGNIYPEHRIGQKRGRLPTNPDGLLEKIIECEYIFAL